MIINKLTINRILFFQLLKFGINGLLVTSLNVLLTWGLIKLGLSAVLSTFISSVIMTVFSYSLHYYITFKDKGKHVHTGSKFLILSVFMISINSFGMYMITDIFHWSYYVGLGFLFFISPVISFTIQRYWVFKFWSQNDHRS